MKNILDLRFIIGLFFALVGLILVIGSFVLHSHSGKSEATNLWSGLVYILFGLFMIALWIMGNKKAETGEKAEGDPSLE